MKYIKWRLVSDEWVRSLGHRSIKWELPVGTIGDMLSIYDSPERGMKVIVIRLVTGESGRSEAGAWIPVEGDIKDEITEEEKELET